MDNSGGTGAAAPKAARRSKWQSPRFLRATVESLTRRAARGDAGAAENLRGRLAEHPELLDGVAGLAARAEAAWVTLASGGNEMVATVIRKEVADLKAGLLGDAPTAVERVIVESFVVSYLAERHGAQRAAEPADSTPVAVLRLRRAESGQRRLLAAAKFLALLRRKTAPGP